MTTGKVRLNISLDEEIARKMHLEAIEKYGSLRGFSQLIEDNYTHKNSGVEQPNPESTTMIIEKQKEIEEERSIDRLKFLEYLKKEDTTIADIHVGIPKDACLMNRTIEMICYDCKFGFDVYRRYFDSPVVKTCPYCSGTNIKAEDHEKIGWYPNKGDFARYNISKNEGH